MNALFTLFARLLCLEQCSVALVAFDAVELIDTVGLVGIVAVHVDEDADLATGHEVKPVLDLSHVQYGVHVMQVVFLQKTDDLHVERLLDL